VPIKNLIPFLQAAGHEVAVQAFYGVQGNTLTWGDVVLYPSQGERYGLDAIGAQARHFGAELVITLIDNWVFPDDYNSRFDAPWLQWFPVDGEPVPEKSARMAALADYPVDVWLAVTVAANRGYPARKAWPEIIAGFSAFAAMHDDVVLYLHTRRSPISELGIYFEPLIAAHEGINGKVAFVDQDALAVGVANEDLATLYQAADVMLLPSMGEGFGLPVAEAQACGCPVITQSCSSMTELTINGIAIQPGQPFWVPVLNYWWRMPEVWRITDALEKMYWRKPQLANEKRKEGVRHFYNEYHWPNVFKRYWMPLLERIESELW